MHFLYGCCIKLMLNTTELAHSRMAGTFIRDHSSLNHNENMPYPGHENPVVRECARPPEVALALKIGGQNGHFFQFEYS